MSGRVQPATHCPCGHEYTPENTIPYHDHLRLLRRICRICEAKRQAAGIRRDAPERRRGRRQKWTR